MENTEKQPMEGNEFSGALKAAKDAGEKTFTVDGKEYDVEECWSKQMDEELHGNQDKLDMNHNGELDSDDFVQLRSGHEQETDEELYGNQDKLDKNHNGDLDAQDFEMLRGQQDEEECMECGYMDENNMSEDRKSVV